MRNMVASTFIEIRLEIAHLREIDKMTWRGMAGRYPAIKEARMAANLCAIYKHGREPHQADIRAVLGLPAYALALVCPRHGVVHISRRCPSDNPKPRRPSLRSRRKALWHSEAWRQACAGMRRLRH